MKTQLLKYLIVATMFVAGAVVLPSCKSYCPGVDGTGNSASRQTRRAISLGKSHCPGTASTGTYKPKVSRKPQDGLMSPKMERQLAKANAKKASPIESKKLSMDQ